MQENTPQNENPGGAQNTANQGNASNKNSLTRLNGQGERLFHEILGERIGSFFDGKDGVVNLRRIATSEAELKKMVDDILKRIESHPLQNTKFSPNEDTKKHLQKITSRHIIERITGYSRAIVQLGDAINSIYELDSNQQSTLGNVIINFNEAEAYGYLNEKTFGLKNYSLESLIKKVFPKNQPVARAKHERMLGIVGSIYDTLSPAERITLDSAVQMGTLSSNQIKSLWKKLDKNGRIGLFRTIRATYSIDELRGLDTNIFSYDIISQAIKIACKKEFPNITDEILDDLEWGDMHSIPFGSEEIVNLLEGQDIDSTMIGSALSFWYNSTIESIESEKRTQQNQISKKEDLETNGNETLTETAISGLKDLVKLKKKKLEGLELLNGSGFKNNDHPLVITLHGSLELYYEIRVAGIDSKGNITGFTYRQIGADGVLYHDAGKQSITRGAISSLYDFIALRDSVEIGTKMKLVGRLEGGIASNSEEPEVGTPPIIKHNTVAEVLGENLNSNDGAQDSEGDTSSGTISESGDLDEVPFEPMGINESGDSILSDEDISGAESLDEESPNFPSDLDGENLFGDAMAGSNLDNEFDYSGSSIQSNELSEEDPPINSLETLNALLQKNGKEPLILIPGSTISVGKAGTKNYALGKISEVHPEKGIRCLSGEFGELPDPRPNDPNYTDGYINFEQLYIASTRRKDVVKIHSPITDTQGFLNFLKENTSLKSRWENLELHDTGKNGEKMFDYSDRRFDREKFKRHIFHGDSEKVIEIIQMDGNTIKARIGHNYTSTNPENNTGATAEWGEEKEFSREYLAEFMLRYSMIPLETPPREIISNSVNDATEKGTIRHMLGRLSINDIFSGGKKFIEEFEHHLKHGNSLQELRVMKGIAEKLGMKSWNQEWYFDFYSKYENEEKKIIEDRLDTLGKMPSPNRQESILASLLNNGTHDYDHWTNALSMIEKHGTLYAGKLQHLEGSWIFFKRIADIPLKANVQDYSSFQEVVARIRSSGIDNITEEAVIEEYMKINSHFPNKQIWRMVKSRSKSGMEGEFESGGKEVLTFNTLDQRITYVLGKMQSREYAHALGGMEAIFDKDGPAHVKHIVPFIFAMSRIPERLPRQYLEKFANIYDAGRLHSPALHFIKDRSSQNIFRDTISELVKIQGDEWRQKNSSNGRSPIEKDHAAMMEAISINTDHFGIDGKMKTPVFSNIRSFWEKYGEALQPELTVNGTIARHTVVADADAHPPLAIYSAKMDTMLSGAKMFNETEIELGTTFNSPDPTSAGGLFIKPQKFIEKLGYNVMTGTFSSDALSDALQGDFILALETLRDREENDLSIEKKKILFKKIFLAYIDKVNIRNIDQYRKDAGTGRLFRNLGFEPPMAGDRESVEKNLQEIREKRASIEGQLNIKQNELKQLTSATVSAQQKRVALEQRRIELQTNSSTLIPGSPEHINAQDELERLSQELTTTRQVIDNYNGIQQFITNSRSEIDKSRAEERAEQIKLHTPSSMDESLEHHRVHFENMFERFMSSNATSQSIRSQIARDTQAILDRGEDPEFSVNREDLTYDTSHG